MAFGVVIAGDAILGLLDAIGFTGVGDTAFGGTLAVGFSTVDVDVDVAVLAVFLAVDSPCAVDVDDACEVRADPVSVDDVVAVVVL